MFTHARSLGAPFGEEVMRVAVLDDTDPACVLQREIFQVIQHHDGPSVVAALALTLSTVMAYGAHKGGLVLLGDSATLCDDLRELAAQVLRGRDELLTNRES